MGDFKLLQAVLQVWAAYVTRLAAHRIVLVTCWHLEGNMYLSLL